MEKINFENLPSTNTPINATNLNQLQTNVETAINGVVESGSNDRGNWIKYEDGTMIQYGITEKSGTIGTQSSSTKWYFDDGYYVHLPQNFINTLYYANVTYAGLGLVTLQVYSTSDYNLELFKFNLSSNIVHTFENYEFRWFAIGKWK